MRPVGQLCAVWLAVFIIANDVRLLFRGHRAVIKSPLFKKMMKFLSAGWSEALSAQRSRLDHRLPVRRRLGAQSFGAQIYANEAEEMRAGQSGGHGKKDGSRLSGGALQPRARARGQGGGHGAARRCYAK